MKRNARTPAGSNAGRPAAGDPAVECEAMAANLAILRATATHATVGPTMSIGDVEPFTLRGAVIAKAREIDTLSSPDLIGEGGVLPELVTRWLGGAEVDPSELYRVFDQDVRSIVSGEDEGRIAVDAILARMRSAFPDDLSAR